jgi:Holliday junction resolvasome RuvABC DNA-binding subunit
VRAPLVDDVASALGQLGWRPTEVDKAIAQLAPASDATFEGLLRQALRSMPR